MLGEKIGEFTGKTIGMRVLGDAAHDHHHGPRMEVTMQQAGKMLGTEINDTGTYESCLQPGGYFTGGGQGVSMSKDGDVVTWKATGVGRPTGKGMGVAWRGSIQYQTTSSKLAKLNGVCCVFEYDVDEHGASNGRVFEWR
jgi:hypothetical protein